MLGASPVVAIDDRGDRHRTALPGDRRIAVVAGHSGAFFSSAGSAAGFAAGLRCGTLEITVVELGIPSASASCGEIRVIGIAASFPESVGGSVDGGDFRTKRGEKSCGPSLKIGSSGREVIR